MFRSRLFTPAFRFYTGLAIWSLVFALVTAISTTLDEQSLDDVGVLDLVLGPISLGWKGSVGSHLTYVLLLSVAVVAAGLAGVLIASRDADPDAQASLVQVERVPRTRPPAGSSYAPLIGALGLAAVAVGLAGSDAGTNQAFFRGGIVAVVIALLLWALRAWAESSTGDDTTNLEIYHKFIDPVRVPVLAVVGVVAFGYGISRLLLAVNKDASTAIFGIAALLLFLVMAALALLPKVSKNVIVVLAVVGVVLVFAAGVFGLSEGARDFEKHGADTEHSE
ncbi:MAG: hypothetical protein MUF83_04190 [Acidimicrobiales bacterium]|jgi:hypothetical protein|nr:hypothetical protein [Acidimicrobiales bacterium]